MTKDELIVKLGKYDFGALLTNPVISLVRKESQACSCDFWTFSGLSHLDDSATESIHNRNRNISRNKKSLFRWQTIAWRDKKLLFRCLSIEKFPLWVKDKETTTYVASGWIVVQRFFRNMGWNMTGPSKDGIYWKLTLVGPNPDTPFH